MHKVHRLDHPLAKEGKVYEDARGVRVLHVFTDLPNASKPSLSDWISSNAGRDAEYDDVFVHTKGETDPDWP